MWFDILKSVELPIEEDNYDPNEIKEAIENDKVLQYYNVPLDKFIDRLTAYNNYEDLMEMLNASIWQEDRKKVRIALTRIKNIISDIKKAEVIYTEDTLKEAGGAKFGQGENTALFGNRKVVGGKKRGKKREEEY